MLNKKFKKDIQDYKAKDIMTKQGIGGIPVIESLLEELSQA